MRVSKLGCLAILALISSCNAPGDVPADTAPVVDGTRSEPAAPGAPAAPATPAERVGAAATDTDRAMPSAAEEARFAGVAGSRFVVFDTKERTIVLDLETEHAFGVYGHVVTEDAQVFDPWSQIGFSPNGVASRIVASDDGTTMLVRTDAGIQAVDLSRHGALLTGWRGDAHSVDIAPDGSMFAAHTSDRIHLVRTSDGARASYAHDGGGSSAPVQWTEDAAYWADSGGVRIVERSSFGGLHVPMTNAYLTASKDGKTFVASRQSSGSEPGVVEVWRLGDARPRSRIVSAHVEQVTVDRDGSRVAWAESSGDYDAPMFLHTLDVASGVHARFSAHGHCSIGVERIVSLEEGILTTDAECSPGCPSLPSQAQFIAYDFASGKKLREWSGELFPPFNEALGERDAKAGELSARLGVSPDERGVLPLVHSPSDDVLVVASGSGLRLVTEENGRVLARLPSSSGVSVEDVHFTANGAHIVGIGEHGRLAVWDATDGRLVWTWK